MFDFGFEFCDSRLDFRCDCGLDNSQDEAKVTHAFRIVFYDTKCMFSRLTEKTRNDKTRQDKTSKTCDKA